MKRPFSFGPKAGSIRRSKSGQALLESFAVIMLLCLILFGMVQYVMMLTATEIIQFSADSSVRARAVGLNNFMARKVNVIASSPNAGARTAPYAQTTTNQGDWESNRNAGSAFRSSYGNVNGSTDDILYFGQYLETLDEGLARAMLNYQRSPWAQSPTPYIISHPRFSFAGNMIRAVVTQDYPLTMPLFRAFSDNDSIFIQGEAEFADHAELYLE